ncbi:unnamed protein product [Parnassius apollo]|uniref:(apollo) hypothetical protein n=1 Tax=Parnassius apollo TaxID=110799 RepID=A0A8S3Y4C0_PARAO|nr:unnamed protein product [Parnassius apollo]
MRAISSFETSCTMRVLILTAALLACTTAAPSGAFFGPIAHIAYSAVTIPSVVPTISPGDLQAAEINAKVQVEQQAQAAADKARELAEQATEKQDEGIIEANDLAKERAEESFWAAEEQKWQALDALKTAEAQIDGSLASRASDVALAAYSVPTANQALTGLLGQSVVAAEPKIIVPEGIKADEQKEKAESNAMGAVKLVQAESKPENAEKIMENDQADAAKMESSASVKTAEEVKEKTPAAAMQVESKQENAEKPVVNDQVEAAKMESSALVKTAEAVKEETPAAAMQAESKQENADKPAENVQAEAAKMDTSASVKTAEEVKRENLAAVFLAQTHQAPLASNVFLAQPWLKQGYAPISYISGLQSYVPNLIPNYNGQVNPIIFRAAW